MSDNYLSQNKWYKWSKPATVIVAIFVIKLLSVLFMVYQGRNSHNPSTYFGIAATTEDSDTYIGPIDNFIRFGSYFWGEAKAGRMPYLGVIYYFLRLLFSKSVALSIMVVLQIICESVAIYLLSELCRQLLQNSKAFWLFAGLACCSLYVTYYDYFIMTESLSASFACYFVYYYYKFLAGRKNPPLFIAAFFLALTVLLKPYLALLYVFVAIELLVFSARKGLSLKMLAIDLLLILGPIMVINSPWTIRNYFVLKKIVPFQEDLYGGYNYPKARLAVRKFIQMTGESFIFWEKNTAGCYFEPRPGKPCNYKLPERIYSSSIRPEDVESARQTYIRYQRRPTPELERATIDKFNRLSQIYKAEHRIHLRFIRPLLTMKKMLIHSGSYYLPFKKPATGYKFWQLALKLFQSLLYYSCLVGGFAGSILLLRKSMSAYMIFLIPVYLIFMLVIVFKLTEYRYFHLAYPFLLLGLCNLVSKVIPFFSTGTQK